MRLLHLLPITGYAVLSAVCLAQAPGSVPTPTPAQAPLPSYPAYDNQSAPTVNVPAPTPGSAPVVAPARPTPQAPIEAINAYDPNQAKAKHYGLSSDGSTYIPLDSWIYPAITRLYSLGYANTMYLAMRPYTRMSLNHILEATHAEIMASNDEQAQGILVALEDYLHDEPLEDGSSRGTVYGTESVYTRLMGIQGQTLNDSYHLGQTLVNDYGRPYQSGFNAIAGFSELVESGRFSLYVRGEYQHAPSATGYSQTLSAALSQGTGLSHGGDGIPFSGHNLHQRTIPTGPIGAANPFRLQEATVSFHLLGHEISGGKSDIWQGPAQGGAMSWSNNAQDIYSFRINRVEPLYIPLFSWLFGTVRYDFIYGDLKGHSDPNSPYVHSEQIEIRPTVNSEIGFQRTVIFGGEGHAPVTMHTFLKSFFDVSDTTAAEKFSREDPGARFSDFSFSWRLPFVRKYVTLVLDSFCHDDVTPISAPRRAAYRTGIYLSQLPHAPRWDFRVEAVTTDPGVSRSQEGGFLYIEAIQRQGYTNEGNIFGDWIGREAKGGQAWLTYHIAPSEFVQLEYLEKKNEKDFIPGVYNSLTNTYGPGGTTQNQFKINVVKRFHHNDVELNAWYQHEGWKAPIYLPGPQSNNTVAATVTFFPKLHRK